MQRLSWRVRMRFGICLRAATIVSTRVLPPRAAVMWAAFFNFIAFLVFGLHVAQTIGTAVAERVERG